MHKNQHRNTRNMNKESNMTPQKEHNKALIQNCKERETDKMTQKEFLKMIVRLLKIQKNSRIKRQFIHDKAEKFSEDTEKKY